MHINTDFKRIACVTFRGRTHKDTMKRRWRQCKIFYLLEKRFDLVCGPLSIDIKILLHNIIVATLEYVTFPLYYTNNIIIWLPIERCLDMMCIVYLEFIAIYQIPYHNICLQFVQLQIQLLSKKFLKYLLKSFISYGKYHTKNDKIWGLAFTTTAPMK